MLQYSKIFRGKKNHLYRELHLFEKQYEQNSRLRSSFLKQLGAGEILFSSVALNRLSLDPSLWLLFHL